MLQAYYRGNITDAAKLLLEFQYWITAFCVLHSNDLFFIFTCRSEGLLAIVITDRDGVPLVKGSILAQYLILPHTSLLTP